MSGTTALLISIAAACPAYFWLGRSSATLSYWIARASLAMPLKILAFVLTVPIAAYLILVLVPLISMSLGAEAANQLHMAGAFPSGSTLDNNIIVGTSLYALFLIGGLFSLLFGAATSRFVSSCGV